jgi:hypothetical protein
MREATDHIAASTLAAYQTIAWKDWVPLAGRLETIEIAHRHPTPEQLARAQALLVQPKNQPAMSVEEVYADRVVRLNAWPATTALPVQALRIGDMALGGLPVEVFVETGLAFKQRSPFQPSFLVSLNNGYYGYLPTPEHHQLGGYETWLGANRLEPEASTKFLTRLLEMLAAMR